MESPVRILGISNIGPFARTWLGLMLLNLACAVLNGGLAVWGGWEWTTPINLFAMLVSLGGTLFCYNQLQRMRAEGK